MEAERVDTAELEEQEGSYQTPGSIISAFSSALKVPLEQTTLRLRGIYVPGNNQNYGGFYYDRMDDETGNDFITLRVPNRIRATMTSGAVHIVLGFVERRVKGERGCIECHFRIIQLLEQEDASADPAAEARLEVITKAVQRSILNPEQTLRNLLATDSKPRIAFLYGESGIVDRDVMTALGISSTYYEIAEFRESLSNPGKISKVLQSLDAGGYDLIAVVRGGGSGLEVFDDLELASTATELTTPLLVALGHEQDHPFLEKVACRYLPTPTALGYWLKKVAEDTHEDRAHSKAKLIEDVEKQSAEHIKSLESQVNDATRVSEERQKTIEGLQKQINARLEAEFRYDRELRDLRTKSNNQAMEISRLRSGEGVRMPLWWLGTTLVAGLFIGILMVMLII